MTDPFDSRAEATRRQILLAASRQFARRPYSRVNLDDILTDAEVTKGAMYFHFRSKHALAVEIVEFYDTTAATWLREIVSRGLSAIETAVEFSFRIAVEDISNDTARAALNLLESVGRTDGLATRVVGKWMDGVADLIRQAVREGDVVGGRDEDTARLLVSLYLGSRQTGNLDEPKRFLGELEAAWALVLPSVAMADRVGFLKQFINRRATVAIRRAAPIDHNGEG